MTSHWIFIINNYTSQIFHPFGIGLGSLGNGKIWGQMRTSGLQHHFLPASENNNLKHDIQDTLFSKSGPLEGMIQHL
jgi:hypothetical protein